MAVIRRALVDSTIFLNLFKNPILLNASTMRQKKSDLNFYIDRVAPCVAYQRWKMTSVVASTVVDASQSVKVEQICEN